MATRIRAELSEKNPYWIDKHRYYELKHFCLQYPIWKKEYASLTGYEDRPTDWLGYVSTGVLRDPTTKTGLKRAYYSERINMIESVARQTDSLLAPYLLKGITEGWPYDILQARMGVPCCKDLYYDMYRRFFWLLDQERR